MLMKDTPDTVRARNMQIRRTRILNEARGILAQRGFEALNLRELARMADVTVPTIYNLIGKKEEVFLALAAEVVAEIESRIEPTDTAEPLSLATAVFAESIRLFAEDEDYYRSAFLSVEGLDQVGLHHSGVEQIYGWVGGLMHNGIDACRKAHLLQGKIPANAMSEMMTRTYRMNCRGWAFGHYGIDKFHDQAMSDLYIILAADAVDTFRARLLRNVTEIESNNSIAMVDSSTIRKTKHKS